MKHLLPLLACTLLVTASQLAAADLKPGDVAPDFALTGSDGQVHRLADLKGKSAVVVAWFPKAFTPGCTRECTSLARQGAVIREFAVAYFAASCDDAETNRKFAESLSADFPILSDPGKAVATAYGVVTPERQVPFRWTFFIGRDGKILHVDKEVKPDDHAQDIASRLEALGVAKK